MHILAKWLVSSLALLGTAYLMPGIMIADFYTALIVALLLGLMNAVIRPVLVFLTLPITVLSLGFFILVINGFIFLSLAFVVDGFHVDGLWTAMIGTIVVSVFSWIGNKFITKDKKRKIHNAEYAEVTKNDHNKILD